jgi:hypothetical protein
MSVLILVINRQFNLAGPINVPLITVLTDKVLQTKGIQSALIIHGANLVVSFNVNFLQ